MVRPSYGFLQNFLFYLVNFSFFIDRFLFFSGAFTFKWVNGVATLLMVIAIIMAVTGELICLWYSTNVAEVKFSLLFIKYNTRIGDLLVRSHKLLIAIAFAAVFLHIGKAMFFLAYYGSRAASWQTGVLILYAMFAASYVGCILPWTVLSPTLYTMIQTIFDTYLGGWAVFLVLGGEKCHVAILARTLVVHILAGLAGLVFLGLHIRAVHFVVSSVNRFYMWSTLDRPLWLPNELVKELYLLFFFFFFFAGFLYRKSASWGSFYSSLNKFYYGGATNWNNLPASIEPEWYFWIMYFALASASSLLGGLVRIVILFASITVLPMLKTVQCPKSLETTEDMSANGPLLMSFIVLFLIFFNRSRSSFWHIYFLDSILFFLLIGETAIVSQNHELFKRSSL